MPHPSRTVTYIPFPCPGTDLDLHLGPARLTDERDDPERQRYVLGGAVAHQLVLAVRGDEADGVLRLELGQLDALVELAVVDGDAGAARASGVVTGACGGQRQEGEGEHPWTKNGEWSFSRWAVPEKAWNQEDTVGDTVSYICRACNISALIVPNFHQRKK